MLRKTILICMVCIMTLAFGQIAGAVALIEQKEIKSENVNVLVPNIKNDKKSPLIAKINEALYADATKYLDEFRKTLTEDTKEYGVSAVKERYNFTGSYAVKFNNRGFVSIINIGHMYTGGAHGGSWKRAVNANLETGDIYKLSDIFKTGSPYKSLLNTAIRRQINESQGWKNTLDFKGVDENTKFYMTGEMLVIFYDEYEIGPYVAGAPEFYIPCRDVEEYFKDDFSVKRYI